MSVNVDVAKTRIPTLLPDIECPDNPKPLRWWDIRGWLYWLGMHLLLKYRNPWKTHQPSWMHTGEAELFGAVGCGLNRAFNGGSPMTNAVTDAMGESWEASCKRGHQPSLAFIGAGHDPSRHAFVEAHAMVWRALQTYPTGHEQHVAFVDYLSVNTRDNAEKTEQEMIHTLQFWPSVLRQKRPFRVLLFVFWVWAPRTEGAFQKYYAEFARKADPCGQGIEFAVYPVLAPFGGTSKWFLNHPLSAFLWDVVVMTPYFQLKGWM